MENTTRTKIVTLAIAVITGIVISSILCAGLIIQPVSAFTVCSSKNTCASTDGSTTGQPIASSGDSGAAIGSIPCGGKPGAVAGLNIVCAP